MRCRGRAAIFSTNFKYESVIDGQSAQDSKLNMRNNDRVKEDLKYRKLHGQRGHAQVRGRRRSSSSSDGSKSS
jgi:hypothetical protein